MTEQAPPQNGYFRFGEYYVDVGDNRVFHGDESKHLEPKAMHVLYQLALCAGETVGREELMDKVWNGRVVLEDALTRIISQLRLTFDDNKSRQLIQTVPKKGYRLTANVSWLSRDEFIARSVQSKPALEPRLPSHKRRWAIATVLSLTLVSILWLLISTHLYPDATKPLTAPSNTRTTTAQPSLEQSAKTIAFLPWRNLTGDTSNDYLAEMLPEELSITLAKSDNIYVLAHYTNMAIANDVQALESMINEFSFDYWIEGSITEANEQIRVLVRLIDKDSSKAVWSEVYAENMQQLLQLNAQIISDIQTQLFGKSTHSMPKPVNEMNIEAYRAYLQGNYWWMNGKTSEWYHRAESAFLQATEQAPDFAAAFGSLAFIYARYDYHDVYMDKAVAVEKATSAIDSALNIDPTEINALLASALLAIEALDFDKAQQQLKTALELEPKHAGALYVSSELALVKNQMDMALSYAKQALKSEPLSPWVNVNLAIVHFWRNEMPEALAAVEQSIKIDSNYTWAYVWKAKIMQQMGELTSAIEAMNACLEIDDGSQLNSIYLALLYKDAGNDEQSQRWFAHTASLYGDSADALFWQSYLRLIEQGGDLSVSRQLLEQVTLKTTRFFSLEPLKKALYSSQPELIKTVLPDYLSSLRLPEQAGFWVNYQNQYQAYVAIVLMQKLNAQGQYEDDLTALSTAISAFEEHVATQLRAKINQADAY